MSKKESNPKPPSNAKRPLPPPAPAEVLPKASNFLF